MKAPWIKVTEQLPPANQSNEYDKENNISERVLIYSQEFGIRFGYFYRLSKTWVVEGVRSSNGIEVTHWLPLTTINTTNTMNWYTNKTSGQPLIIDEATGKTIAVCYTSQRDARIIAYAPKMLSLLRMIDTFEAEQLINEIEEDEE